MKNRNVVQEVKIFSKYTIQNALYVIIFISQFLIPAKSTGEEYEYVQAVPAKVVTMFLLIRKDPTALGVSKASSGIVWLNGTVLKQE